MNQEELVYELGGKKYILVEYVTIEGYEKKRDNAVRALGLIFQGVAKIDRGGMLSNGYAVERFFLPEENFMMWANYDFK